MPDLASALPIIDELVKRSAILMKRCLSIESTTVSSVANLAIFHSGCRLLVVMLSFAIHTITHGLKRTRW
jgi:hypothetical protein